MHPDADELIAQRKAALAFIKGCLFDAAQESYSLSKADPEVFTTEYLDGFGSGRRAGTVQALAVAVAAITGESPTLLVSDAFAQAQVESEFPFEFSWEEA